jgi:predicted nucleotidyltransferase
VLIIDSERFYDALRRQGYRSLKDFAHAIGVHRNTLQHYLSGRGVLPASIETAAQALGVSCTDILMERRETSSGLPPEVAHVIDVLHEQFPRVTFVLFGSRAKGKAHRYSDWDVGIFSRHGVDHETYRKILRMKDELAEDLSFAIDIVNLHNADRRFLCAISRSWIMLAGMREDWIDLERRTAA